MENTTTPSTAVAIVGARGRGKTTVCNGLIRETMERLGRDDDGAREARGGWRRPCARCAREIVSRAVNARGSRDACDAMTRADDA